MNNMNLAMTVTVIAAATDYDVVVVGGGVCTTMMLKIICNKDI